MTERLTERKVNVDFIYGSSAIGRNRSVLVIEAKSTK